MATTSANEHSSSQGTEAELTPTVGLHPKPVAMEDTFASSSYHRSLFDNDSSRSNNSNHINNNGNNRQDQRSYQQEQSVGYPTRPLHLPHPDDPTASLTSIFNQAHRPQNQQRQQPGPLPLAPIFRRPESISTQGATANFNHNNNHAFDDYVLVTPTEEGSTTEPTTKQSRGVKEKHTPKTQEQERVEESLNCAAAFFGINIESAFPPPKQQEQASVARSVTASPTMDAASSGDLWNNRAAAATTTTSSTNKDNEPTPTKSIPVKIQTMKDTSANSFDPQAVHRRSSAPCVYDSPSPSGDDMVGSGYGTTATNNNRNNNEPEYGLSRSHPADYVDPKDQHLWRAKFCVLEEGVLYFYRTKDEAESQEAKQERTSSLADFGGGNSNSIHPNTNNTNSTTKKQLADLSKSPMASRTCLLIPGIDGGSPSTASNSNSNSNSDAESYFMWEKRVALNCVGAVRSAETEYGKNAFELLAVDDNEDEDGHTNKLVLKAPKQEEMNEWIFQFHRSLASFVMNMVDLVGGGGVSTPSYALGDIHHPGFDQNGVGGLLNALQTPVRSYNMSALSPRFVRNMPSPSVQSLSHGHGRSQMRRKQPGINHTLSSGGSVHSVPSTPANRSPTELQFPLSNSSSAAAASLANTVAALNLVTPLKHGGLRLPEPEVFGSRQQRQKEGSSPKFSEPELSAPVAINPETERPPAPPNNTGGKYVPPHLRKMGGKKYVPPHLRNKDNDAAVPAAVKPPSVKYLPPHQRENHNQNKAESSSILNSTLLPRTTPPAAMYMQSESSLVPETPNNSEPKEAFFRLGGCADPLVIGGSILDQQYIAKKASRVGHVNTDAHGSFGGRKDATSGDSKARSKSNATSLSLEWEIGAVSECGIRDSNEDAYFVTNDLVSSFSGLIPGALAPTYWDGDSDHNSGLFAIFDGHCGNQAARFSAERLPHFLYEESRVNDGNIGPALTEEIMRQAIEKMDEEFCRVCVEGGREWESGSTALVAMLANEHLVIASIGDCRGVLCRRFAQGSQQPANLDGEIWNELIADQDGSSGPACFWREVADVHSPSRQDEKSRIEKAGGWTTVETEIPISQLQRMDFLDQDVVDILRRCFQDRINNTQGSKACSSSAPQRILQISRVCGELAVSRAIGDRDFKAAWNLPPSGDAENDEWETSLFLPYPNEHSRQFVGDLVSSKPDFQTMRVGEADTEGEFLVLACDGLWDVMDMDDAVRVTQDLLFKKKCPAKQAVRFHW